MTPAASDLRLAVPAAALWVTCGVVTALPDALGVAAGLAVLAATTSAVALLVRRSGRRVAAWIPVLAVVLGISAAGSIVVTSTDSVRRPAPLVRAVAQHRTVELDLRLEAVPAEGRVRGTAERVAWSAGEWRIRSPVLLFADRIPERRIGELVRTRVELRAAEAGDRVAFLGFAHGPVVRAGEPSALERVLGDVRARFAAACRELPDPGGGLLPGLAIGDTSAVDARLEADMRTASLTHLTAVSGANCAVIVGLAVVLLGALGAPRIVRIAGAAVLLLLFVVLVTPQPSVIRAAAMSLLLLVATAVGRPVRGVPLLAAAVVVLLLGDPWLARDYGFALSVLATGGLLVLAPPLSDRLSRVLPRPIALAIAVPTAAQLACQPVLLLLTPVVPLWGVPANLLAEPAAPLATVLGLVACVLLPVAPPLGNAMAWLAWVPSSWIAGVARTSAGLPAASLPWLPGTAGVVVMILIVVLTVTLLLTGHRRPRIVACAGLLLAGATWGGSLVGSSVAENAGRPADWQYAECDIGQGDSTVIRSAGRVALVDTGPDPLPMRACLDDLGISRIDLLVLTHYDLDHVGGTDAVVGRVDRALIGPSSGADDDRVAARVRGGGARVEEASEGLRGRLGDLEWRVLWPPERGVEPGNAASVTLSVEPRDGCVTACLSALLLGDLGAESQTRMLGSIPLGRYDVVKVAHHGSADQAPALYSRIRAPVGLIGVGADNDYGHPTAFCLRILADAGTRPFRTDRRGLVLVADASDGSARVWTQKDDEAARRPSVLGSDRGRPTVLALRAPREGIDSAARVARRAPGPRGPRHRDRDRAGRPRIPRPP